MAAAFAEETTSSSSSSSSSHFSGLSPDELQRVSILSRAEAVQLRSLFKAASSELDSRPGLLLTSTELDEMETEIKRREERVEALLKILPENPDSITALSGEAERYKDDIQAVNWPLETQSVVLSSSSSSSSSSSLSSSSSSSLLSSSSSSTSTSLEAKE
jgi:hypothetical protein